MRKLTSALVVAFAMGGLAPIAAQAGEGCSYGSHAVKKNDLEAPLPASATKTETEKKG